MPPQSTGFEDSTSSASTHDTEILSDVGDQSEDSISEEICSSQLCPTTAAMQKELSADNENDQWPSKANKVIVKAVFGKLVMRDEAVAVLKKRFNVQQKHLTGLVPGQLYAVMAKKLVLSKYCTLLNKQNIKNLKRSDLTVAKEIKI